MRRRGAQNGLGTQVTQIGGHLARHHLDRARPEQAGRVALVRDRGKDALGRWIGEVCSDEDIRGKVTASADEGQAVAAGARTGVRSGNTLEEFSDWRPYRRLG